MKAILRYIPIFIVALAALTACEEVPDKFETEDDLISITKFLYENDETYSGFVRVMEAGELVSTLQAYNPLGDDYTLFLPSNAAFDEYVAGSDKYSSLSDLAADTDFVRALSRYHVVNRAIESSNFPLGALPDSCLTGDYLVIAYIQEDDSTFYKVNNKAELEVRDQAMTNGIVHVIDRVLEPVTYSGIDWLKENEDYSILAELFELTGLDEQMGIYVEDQHGRTVLNRYSVLAEADSIFYKNGIQTLDDLISEFGEGQTDYTEYANPLYQFAAYHILDRSWFLADLNEGSYNYNTFASLPVQVVTGVDIRVNPGVEIFDSVYQPQSDTWLHIDYLEVNVNYSNIQTRNGPIHLVNRVLELYRPGRSRRTFEFYEEPLINQVRNEAGTYIFTDPEEFTELYWTDAEDLTYIKSSASSEKANNKDYIIIAGDFEFSYTIPKILPGTYGMQLKVNTASGSNATIQVYLDGKKIGGNLNLTTGGASSSNPYRVKNMGVIEFGKYEEHTLTIRTLIPGALILDFVRFDYDLNRYDSNNQ